MIDTKGVPDMTTLQYTLLATAIALTIIVTGSLACAAVLSAVHGTTIQQELRLADLPCTVLGCQVATV